MTWGVEARQKQDGVVPSSVGGEINDDGDIGDTRKPYNSKVCSLCFQIQIEVRTSAAAQSDARTRAHLLLAGSQQPREGSRFQRPPAAAVQRPRAIRRGKLPAEPHATHHTSTAGTTTA